MLKFLFFTALMGIVLTSCQDPTPKVGIIRTDSGMILEPTSANTFRVVPAKWHVMHLKRFTDTTSLYGEIVIDSVVFAIKPGDTLKVNGKPIWDSLHGTVKFDTGWKYLIDPTQLTFSHLHFHTNPSIK